VLGPVSGAHLKPVVSTADWLLGRRHGTGLTGREAVGFGVAQVAGGVLGALLANVMFDLPAGQISGTERASLGHAIGEVVATAGLVLLIFGLARTGRPALSAASVGAYIGAAYWFTSSTSFANPAVTVGRMPSDTFAGISPTSVPLFVAAQVVGAAVGLTAVLLLVPNAGGTAGRAVIPQQAAVSTEKSDPHVQAQRAVRLRTQRRPVPDGRRLPDPPRSGQD
jgi:glycerol uptake facilitator-like aquaporin